MFNEGWKDTAADDRRAVQSSRAIDKTSQTITLVRNEKWWGNRAKLDRIVYRAISSRTRRSTRWPTARSTRWTSAPTRTSYNRAKAIDGVEIAFGRRAELPPPHHQRHQPDPAGRQGSSGARDGDRSRRDRHGAARPARRSMPKPLSNHIFMANQAGYQDNSGDVGKYDPARAAQLLDEAGWKLEGEGPEEGRQAARDHVRDSGRRRDLAAGGRADPEHARAGRRHGENRRRCRARLLRQVRHAWAVRLHRVLVDRHAVSDQLVEVDLRQAEDESQGRARRSSRTTRASAPTRSTGCSTRPTRSSTARRRSRSRTESTR